MTDTPNTLWVRGYTGDGFQVAVTVDVTRNTEYGLTENIQFALDAIRAAGIHPREQGTELGENTNTLDAVIRRDKRNNDGTDTPVIDFYVEQLEFKALHTYLNTQDDVKAFEQATGLTLDAIPYYEGNAALNKNDRQYAKYATPVPTRPRYAYKKNPKWDDSKSATENGVPKYLFTRWLDAGTSSTPANGTQSTVVNGTTKFDQIASAYTFTCTRIETHANKDGSKKWYVFHGPDNTNAVAWSLTEIGADKVYAPDRVERLHAVGNYVLSEPITVHWVPGKKDGERKVTRIERVQVAEEQFTDIPF